MTIDTGKILGISDKQYFDLIENKSPSYLYANVNIKVSSTFQAREIFAETISENAEVVVNYKEKVRSNGKISLSGTALIPKSSLEAQLKEDGAKIQNPVKRESRMIGPKGEDMWRFM